IRCSRWTGLGVHVGPEYAERPDGQQAWIEISTEPVRTDESDQLQAVVATFSDITARIRTEQALRKSEEQLSLAAEGAKLGMWDWHLDSQQFTFNSIAARMLGYRENEVAANVQSVRALAHPDDEERLVDEMTAHLGGTRPFFEVDVRMRCKTGRYAWTNMRGRVNERDRDDKPVRVTGMLIDISRRKELEAQLQRLATTDELTGLFNRRQGTEVLRQEVERACRGSTLSLILLDIDHFKAVNDRFGHDVGDKVLADVAALLQSRLRKTDYAARWGGEEFAIILPQTDRDGGRRFAAELLTRMLDIKTPDGKGLSASFGVVDYRDDESVSELVKRADRLMYRAKHGGRARVETE
ncbi:MAG: diguanylate cyclase, partial [Wenzhouxiangellaceae bacterium]